MERIPIPYLAGDFVTVYRPVGDVYRGLDTPKFQSGTYALSCDGARVFTI